MQARHRSYVRLPIRRFSKGAHIYTSTSCESIDYETGTVTFTNGRVVPADLIVGADGVGVIIHPINLNI